MSPTTTTMTTWKVVAPIITNYMFKYKAFEYVVSQKNYRHWWQLSEMNEDGTKELRRREKRHEYWYFTVTTYSHLDYTHLWMGCLMCLTWIIRCMAEVKTGRGFFSMWYSTRQYIVGGKQNRNVGGRFLLLSVWQNWILVSDEIARTEFILNIS